MWLEPKIVNFRARGLPRGPNTLFWQLGLVRIVREVDEIVRDRIEIEWRLISASSGQLGALS